MQIDWTTIPEEYEWVVQDADGARWAFECLPDQEDDEWVCKYGECMFLGQHTPDESWFSMICHRESNHAD